MANRAIPDFPQEVTRRLAVRTYGGPVERSGLSVMRLSGIRYRDPTSSAKPTLSSDRSGLDRIVMSVGILVVKPIVSTFEREYQPVL